MSDHGHLIFECGTDHGPTMVDHVHPTAGTSTGAVASHPNKK